MFLHTTKPTTRAAATAATIAMAALGIVVPVGTAAAAEPGYDKALPCFLQATPEEERSCLLDTSDGYLDKLRGDEYLFTTP